MPRKPADFDTFAATPPEWEDFDQSEDDHILVPYYEEKMDDLEDTIGKVKATSGRYGKRRYDEEDDDDSGSGDW
jgi:hypothetical protein